MFKLGTLQTADQRSYSCCSSWGFVIIYSWNIRTVSCLQNSNMKPVIIHGTILVQLVTWIALSLLNPFNFVFLSFVTGFMLPFMNAEHFGHSVNRLWTHKSRLATWNEILASAIVQRSDKFVVKNIRHDLTCFFYSLLIVFNFYTMICYFAYLCIYLLPPLCIRPFKLFNFRSGFWIYESYR